MFPVLESLNLAVELLFTIPQALLLGLDLSQLGSNVGFGRHLDSDRLFFRLEQKLLLLSLGPGDYLISLQLRLAQARSAPQTAPANQQGAAAPKRGRHYRQHGRS